MPAPRGRQGFDFLGFHHRKVESWKWRGRYYLQRWPSARAMASIRAKIRDADRTAARSGWPWRRRGRRPQPRAAGLGQPTSAKGTPRRKFSAIDGYVHERLAILASRKHGRSGPELDHPLHLRAGWTRLGVYRLTGNGALGDCACQTVNDVGKPCAGEPHARFEAAGTGNGATDRGHGHWGGATDRETGGT